METRSPNQFDLRSSATRGRAHNITAAAHARRSSLRPSRYPSPCPSAAEAAEPTETGTLVLATSHPARKTTLGAIRASVPLVALLAWGSACGGSSKGDETHAEDTATEQTTGGEQGAYGSGEGQTQSASTSSEATMSENDPRISRSRGLQGGVVVLWPRVLPANMETSSEAKEVQSKLTTIARSLVIPKAVDARPAPERVCSKGGCIASSVGAVLLKKDNSCAVVATVSHPGTSEQYLLPVLGNVTIRNRHIPFREPAESEITVNDYGKCDDIHKAFVRHSGELEEALRQTLVIKAE